MDTIKSTVSVLHLLTEDNKKTVENFAEFLLCRQDNIVEIPNAETIAAIEEAENGNGLSEPFSDVKSLMEALDA